MTATALDDSSRAALEARWLHLTRDILPALARDRHWPVIADHCFQRILLDNAVGGCWYDHVAARPAYRHATEAILRTAIALGQATIIGTADIVELNSRSLTWRRIR